MLSFKVNRYKTMRMKGSSVFYFRGNKERTVSFSGYRPHKFDFSLIEGSEYDLFTARLFDEITNAIENDYDTFISGAAPGFDIVAAELVIFAKRVYPEKGIKLICALPYGNFKDSKHFDSRWRDRYDSVIDHCHKTIYVTNSTIETIYCYDRRNKFMVDNCSQLICYHNGKSGGTESTIKYAESRNIKIVNIAACSQSL